MPPTAPSVARPPLLGAVLCVALLLLPPAATAGAGRSPDDHRDGRGDDPPATIEDYAGYQPATRCSPAAKPGTRTLSRFVVRAYGGRAGPISRRCTRRTRVTSEHQEGRAVDWMVDARTTQGRRTAQAFLDDLFATDPAGNTHARARRMGVMYVIWDDRMYAAWDAFRPEPYLSSSCPSRRKCSPTLRHRDHVHVSLTREAAQGRTSWFERRAAQHAAD